jgi:hypothetical protein
MNAPSIKLLRAILVHGMGCTPAAMLVLAARLRAAGLRPDLFAYSAAMQGWEGCVGRLKGFIDRRAAGTDFVGRRPFLRFRPAARRFAPRRLVRPHETTHRANGANSC